MSTTEQKAYFRFTVRAVALTLLIVSAVSIFTFIVADRMLGFQHQMIRYHEEVINGRYEMLKNPDLLIIGDSTASQSLIPSEFQGLRAVSLAASGTSAVESYYRLREYLEKNRKPRCVLFMTSYGAQQFHIDTLFWPLIVGHGLLKYDQIIDYYDTSKKLNQWPGNAISPLSVPTKILSERFQYYVQFGMLNQAIFQPNLMFNHPQRSYRLFRRTYGGGPVGRGAIWLEIPFDGPNQGFLKDEFRPNPVLDHYIRKILELTKEHGIHLYSDYSPVAASLRNEISSGWLRQSMQHLEGIMKPFAHAKSLLDVEWYVDTSFTDATHLNWNAARKYSAKVAQEVSDCSKLSTR
jgi:hypothetical protein